ncbi:MAG: family 10 glycosylhydrolase [Verrucomicrobia bacterium]|nr:family 10 glycosylhydrolase [Verrucomicrobiota bacterium]
MNCNRIGRIVRLWPLAAGLALASFPLPAQEYRAFWADAFHPGFRSAAEVTKLISDVRAANANAVIVEVRKRGDAYYESRFEPWALDISPPGFDPLQDLLAKAHDTNAGPRIEVHAWMVTYPIWSSNRYYAVPPQPDHPFNLHPDWLTEDVDGDMNPASYSFDPGHPSVQEHTFNVAMDILERYDVDGLNFDYVRYPGNTWGYNPVAVARFNQRFGRAGTPLSNDPQWRQWRRDQVTALVRKVYVCAQAVKPQVKISADTITWAPSVTSDTAWTNNARAYYDVLQDWRSWMEEGILDLNIPMNYFRQNNATYAADFINWKNFALDRKFNRDVVIGPGIYLNSISNGLLQMRLTREPSPAGKRAAGVCGYSYAVPASNSIPDLQRVFLEALTQPSDYDPITPPIFATPVSPPGMPWKTAPATGHLKGFVLSPLGAGWDGATVTLAGPETRTLLTDATGFFGAVDLAPGTYTLTAAAGGYEASPAAATVSAGSVATCDLPLMAPMEFLDLAVLAGERAAILSWTTPEPASSQAEFGTDAACDRRSGLDTEPVVRHSVWLTGLSPATEYCVRALSIARGSEYRSTNLWFRTSPEIVVDNADAVFDGNWSSANVSTQCYLEDYSYTSAVGDTATRWARFVPAMATPGKYDVFAWHPDGSNRSTNAPHRIVFEGGSVTVAVNQQTGGGQWQLLASRLPFGAGTAGFVEISNATGEKGLGRVVMADAVRFVYSAGQDTPSDATVPAWWARYYLGPAPDPALDPDNDGYPTWLEYRLGTVPTNAASRLELRLELQPALTMVFSPCHPDRAYGLQRRAHLGEAPWEPLSLAPWLMLPNGAAAWTLPLPAAHCAFFRLTVDWSL